MKWFGVDGELVALPNPIKYVSTRPSFNPNYSAELETEYRRAIYLEDFSDNINNGNPNMKNITRYQIDLDINQIQFSYHHLFSAEHVLAFKLKNSNIVIIISLILQHCGVIIYIFLISTWKGRIRYQLIK